MRNFRRMTILLILVVIMVFACAPKAPVEPETEVITESVKMYYGDANNENFVTEDREISYNKGEDKYKIVLEELIKGPRNNNYQANISANTKVYGTIVQNNDLIVD